MKKKLVAITVLIVLLLLLQGVKNIQAVNLGLEPPTLPIPNPTEVTCTSEDTTIYLVDTPICRSATLTSTGGVIKNINISIFHNLAASIWDISNLSVSVEVFDYYGNLLGNNSVTTIVTRSNNSRIVSISFINNINEVEVGAVNITINCEGLCIWFPWWGWICFRC